MWVPGMKRVKKKLQLESQTLVRLSPNDLTRVGGGGFWPIGPCTAVESGCGVITTQGSVRSSGCAL